MASTNITTWQSTGIAINVEVLKATLQAIKQRVLGAVASIMAFASSQHSSLFTPFPTDGRLPVAFHSSLIRLYRHELRMARAVARAIDKHPTLSNIALWLMGIALAFEVFMFA